MLTWTVVAPILFMVAASIVWSDKRAAERFDKIRERLDALDESVKGLGRVRLDGESR